MKSSKTYISRLEEKLKVEKDARIRLEVEIEEIKRISSEISSQLGISIKGDA
jgi:hypothetical protein